MGEQIVSFETARLAKEKGFNEDCYQTYNSDSIISSFPILEDMIGNQINDPLVYKWKNSLIHESITSAPTQSLLQKWLREVYDVHVNPSYQQTINGVKLSYNLSVISNKYKYLGKYSYHDTYEEALEAGLQEALKLI